MDFLHRSGNVHDSNGAREFILHYVQRVRNRLPGVSVKVRMDSAFFNAEILALLNEQDAEFTISGPVDPASAGSGCGGCCPSACLCWPGCGGESPCS